MRIRAVVGIIAIAIAALGVGLLTPASGQAPPNTFTVVKVVEGPVPAGAVFEVTVTCVDNRVDAAPAEGFPPVTMTFDEDGNPLDDNSLDVNLYTDCTAEETVTNGAAVTYACEASAPVPGSPAEGPALVSCLDDQTVRYDEVVGAEGTITVTNTFEEPPPVVDDDDVVDDDVVTATPPFTG